MQFSLDRIENGIAVLISRDDPAVRLNLPAALLPAGANEGDILTLTLERDEAAAESAKARVAALQERLKRRQ
ncbi:MAG: DUF3006 domain-containing protein [Methanomicrobiales archaeon]|nr:DUF3006 domain-containing protein [Methanomicrobiales archaeon]